VRREITVAIAAEGRDKGKHFRIREMPAMDGEWWATRLLLLLAKSGTDVPPEILSAGMEGIAYFGIKALAGVDPRAAKELLDEMLTCIKIIPDPAQPAFVRDLVGQDDIEEVRTLATLRDEVLKLHTGFSIAERLSASLSPPIPAPTGQTT